MEKRYSRTTREQFEAMTSELKKYPKLAKGGFVMPADKPYYNKCWKDIATKLNALGPPRRTIVGWKKVWVDLKSRSKKSKQEISFERDHHEHDNLSMTEEESQIVPKEEIDIDEVTVMSPTSVADAETVKFELEEVASQAEDSVAETEESVYAKQIEEDHRIPSSIPKKRRRVATKADDKALVVEILKRNEQHLEGIMQAMTDMSRSVATASNAIVEAAKAITAFAAAHTITNDT